MTNILVCIYIGNQETSASLFNNRTKERYDLDIHPGRKIIPSALSIIQKGEDSIIYIGEQALYNISDASYFQRSFSGAIDSISSQEGAIFTRFLQCLIDNILKNNQHLIEESFEVVLISRWRNQKLLFELANTAGIPTSNVFDSAIPALGLLLFSPFSVIPVIQRGGYDRYLIIEIDEQETIFSIISKSGILKSCYKLGISSIIREFCDYIISHPNDSQTSLDKVILKENTFYNCSIIEILSNHIVQSYEEYVRNEKRMNLCIDYDLVTGGIVQDFGIYKFNQDQIDTILSNITNKVEKLLSFVKQKISYDKNHDVACLIGGSHIHGTLRNLFRKYFENGIYSDDESPFLYLHGLTYWIDENGTFSPLLNKQIKLFDLFYDFNMRPITEQTEFIIGIDFGHGETSARFYNLQNQDQEDIDILPGQKVIKSAVAILRQEGVETICVGDSAIQKAPMAIDFQVSFKKRPSEMKPDERKRMVAFMKGVYEGILDRHPDYKTRDHRVFIARPSQDKIWKNEEAAYIAIAEEAGLPVAGIQKESRAAYFRARTQPDSKIDHHVEKGVLIVDFGSSTIDFTYLNKDLTQPIDDGADLGANAVETALLKYSLSHPNPLDAVMPEFSRIYGSNTSSNAYNQLLYKFRVAKEEFYGKRLLNFSVGIDYSLITSAEQTQLVGFGGVTLTRNDVRMILESEEYGKYIPTVEAAVKKFKDEKLKNQKVACVYLTGGASRMDFVRDIFMKIFNLNAEQCPSDDNPSLIVSQGVAHLSYADYKTQEKEKELRAKAKKIIDSFDWDGKIKEIVFSNVKQSIIDKAKYIMLCYKEGDIYDYHTVDGGYENGIYYGFGLVSGKKHDEGYSNRENKGYLRYRNVESLIKKFKSEFSGYTKHDFGTACEELVKNQIISLIYNELKEAFSKFEYDAYKSKSLSISGLSARLSSSGADALASKFTEEGDGHVLYDAVSSCYLAMATWNIYKYRLDIDRKQHYDYYMSNYSSIYGAYSWESFLKDYVSISGISSIKSQVKSFVEEMISEYISYAKLAIFFK